MAIVRRDPFRELNLLRSQMDRIFENLVDRSERDEWGKASWYPPVDIYETESSIVLKAEIPGVDKKDMEIKIEDDTLTIKGEKKVERDTKTENFLRAERAYGAFQRSFTLPKTVERENIKASLKKGVLTLILPKKEEVRPKQISIQVEE